MVHESNLALLDSPVAVFEDALEQLDSDLPVTTKLGVPQDPLKISQDGAVKVFPAPGVPPILL